MVSWKNNVIFYTQSLWKRTLQISVHYYQLCSGTLSSLQPAWPLQPVDDCELRGQKPFRTQETPPRVQESQCGPPCSLYLCKVLTKPEGSNLGRLWVDSAFYAKHCLLCALATAHTHQCSVLRGGRGVVPREGAGDADFTRNLCGQAQRETKPETVWLHWLFGAKLSLRTLWPPDRSQDRARNIYVTGLFTEGGSLSYSSLEPVCDLFYKTHTSLSLQVSASSKQLYRFRDWTTY